MLPGGVMNYGRCCWIQPLHRSSFWRLRLPSQRSGSRGGSRCLQAEFHLTASLHIVFAKPGITADWIGNRGWLWGLLLLFWFVVFTPCLVSDSDDWLVLSPIRRWQYSGTEYLGSRGWATHAGLTLQFCCRCVCGSDPGHDGLGRLRIESPSSGWEDKPVCAKVCANSSSCVSTETPPWCRFFVVLRCHRDLSAGCFFLLFYFVFKGQLSSRQIKGLSREKRVCQIPLHPSWSPLHILLLLRGSGGHIRLLHIYLRKGLCRDERKRSSRFELRLLGRVRRLQRSGNILCHLPVPWHHDPAEYRRLCRLLFVPGRLREAPGLPVGRDRRVRRVHGHRLPQRHFLDRAVHGRAREIGFSLCGRRRAGRDVHSGCGGLPPGEASPCPRGYVHGPGDFGSDPRALPSDAQIGQLSRGERLEGKERERGPESLAVELGA